LFCRHFGWVFWAITPIGTKVSLQKRQERKFTLYVFIKRAG
jgi:hypothetical protein